MGKDPNVPGLARANLPLPCALTFASPPCSDHSGTVYTLLTRLVLFFFILHNDSSASLSQGRLSINAFLGRGCWGSCQFVCRRKACFGQALAQPFILQPLFAVLQRRCFGCTLFSLPGLHCGTRTRKLSRKPLFLRTDALPNSRSYKVDDASYQLHPLLAVSFPLVLFGSR